MGWLVSAEQEEEEIPDDRKEGCVGEGDYKKSVLVWRSTSGFH